nr:immunoglobulin light chain junction region [Macaca mulatta]
CQQYESDPYSF